MTCTEGRNSPLWLNWSSTTPSSTTSCGNATEMSSSWNTPSTARIPHLRGTAAPVSLTAALVWTEEILPPSVQTLERCWSVACQNLWFVYQLKIVLILISWLTVCFTTVELVLPSLCLCLMFMCLRSSLILEFGVLFNFLHLGLVFIRRLYGAICTVQSPLDCEIKAKYVYTLNIVGEKHICIQRLYLARFFVVFPACERTPPTHILIA